MTQTPTTPPGFDEATPPSPSALEPAPTRPWSAAAITGFVLSLLGCASITALLGLTFGIIGIFKTKDGQRRGLGLAVAAIPISVVTGLLSILLFLGIMTAYGMAPLWAQLTDLLQASDVTTAATAVRGFCSDDFNEEVGDEDLERWLGEVRKTHGKFVEIEPSSARPTQTPGGGIRLSQRAKFVNGSASVTIELIKDGMLQFKINDVAIDGVSPREAN